METEQQEPVGEWVWERENRATGHACMETKQNKMKLNNNETSDAQRQKFFVFVSTPSFKESNCKKGTA